MQLSPHEVGGQLGPASMGDRDFGEGGIMGYMVHHGIIVTCSDKKRARAVCKQAKEIFGETFKAVESAINSYYTILIPPDGSKDGWSESEAGNVCRESFIEWLRQQKHEDGSSPYTYAHVQYGDDEGDNKILETEKT